MVSRVFLFVVANDFFRRADLDKWTLGTSNSECYGTNRHGVPPLSLTLMRAESYQLRLLFPIILNQTQLVRVCLFASSTPSPSNYPLQRKDTPVWSNLRGL